MDNTFTNLIAFKAFDAVVGSFAECLSKVRRLAGKKMMPIGVSVTLLLQFAQPIQHEVKLVKKSFEEDVKKHLAGEKNTSQPEPQGFPGPVVGMTVAFTNTASSVAIVEVPARHAMRLVINGANQSTGKAHFINAGTVR